MAGGYKELAAGERFLKNLAVLVEDPQEGITQDDLDSAEVEAKARIDGALARLYFLTGWTDSPPPLVAIIADKLGSAIALSHKFARGVGGNSSFAQFLETDAVEMLEKIVTGELALVSTDGVVLTRRARSRPYVPES